MRKQLGFKGINWLLILALLVTIAAPTGLVRAEETCYDELGDTIYYDCPPPELLEGKSRKARSELLQQWQKLSSDIKAAYRKYVECKKDVAKLEEELKKAEADKSLDERHSAAVKELKRALTAAMGKLGLSVFEIFVNAALDAYLFGKKLQESVNDEGGAKAKARAEFEAAADKAQRLTTEAAKRQKYFASLEADLAAAEQRVAAAEATRAAATEKPPTGTGATTPGTPEKPPGGRTTDTATGPEKPPSGTDPGGPSEPRGGKGGSSGGGNDGGGGKGGSNGPGKPSGPVDQHTPDLYFRYDPNNPLIFSEGKVIGGPDGPELLLNLRTKALATGERGILQGAEEYANIFQYFRGRFKHIRGQWESWSDNLKQFNENIKKGMSREDAALNTWSGGEAQTRGYTKAVIRTVEGPHGQHTYVEVTFMQP